MFLQGYPFSDLSLAVLSVTLCERTGRWNLADVAAVSPRPAFFNFVAARFCRQQKSHAGTYVVRTNRFPFFGLGVPLPGAFVGAEKRLQMINRNGTAFAALEARSVPSIDRIALFFKVAPENGDIRAGVGIANPGTHVGESAK